LHEVGVRAVQTRAIQVGAARVHFHWASGLGLIICTNGTCDCQCISIQLRDWAKGYARTAFARGSPLDFWIRPDYMHHLRRICWCSSIGLLDGAKLYALFAFAFVGASSLDFWTGPDYMHPLHCICWGISIGLLDWTRLYGPIAPHLLVHFHLTYGLDEIICTICDCVCGCIFIGFLDWTRLYAPIALQLLGHFHWTSGLGQMICTICCAFARAFPLDFWTGPVMHHTPLRLQVHPHGNYGWDRSVCWCIFIGVMNWTGL
jgi:hypothetical protein